MIAKRGYYSLIQFCPDSSRLEAINVGVVLFCPNAEFLDARTTTDNRRAAKLVGSGELQRGALTAAKQALEHRLTNDRASFKDLDDLQRFIDSRGNWLRLTPPRPIKVMDDAVKALDNLFDELVGGPQFGMRGPMEVEKHLFPVLNEKFMQLNLEGRAYVDLRVKVPVLGRSLSVPFAYTNGTINFVKPHRFSRREDYSIESAMRLALEGNLIHRHPTLIQSHGAEQTSAARLIIVSSYDEKMRPEVAKRVNGLFEEYEVENIEPHELPDFLKKVEREAH